MVKITPFQIKTTPKISRLEQVPRRLIDALWYLVFIYLRIKKVEIKM